MNHNEKAIVKPIPVILDGDPGHDDAIAWLIAAASPELEIKAVTTVAGNKDIHNVTNNALKVCSLYGIEAPVAMGAHGPLVVPGITAGEFHGKTGLDGVDLPDAWKQLSNLSGVELMEQVLEETAEPMVIIATGAETNVATLLLHRPDLKSKIRAIHVMGGGIEMGNWNPAAEFNILVDPEAAAIVFSSGIPVVMSGLDVTERALVYPEDVERIRGIGTELSRIVACWLDFFGETHKAMGYEGWPLHDPCAVLSLIHPELFTIKAAYLQVEQGGIFNRGAILADFEAAELYNGKAVMDVNREAFVDTLVEMIETYSDKIVLANAPETQAISVQKADFPWKEELPIQNGILLLTEGPTKAALALKVWPEAASQIREIVYAGGTLWRGDATPWAEASVYEDPKSMESLLNVGVPVVFCTLEAAAKRDMTPAQLAKAYVEKPKAFEHFSCGVHVETSPYVPSRGKLICDRKSDHKFENINCKILI